MRLKPIVLCVVLGACADRCSCSCGEATTERSTEPQQTAKPAPPSTPGMRDGGLGMPIVDLSRANAWMKEAEASKDELAAAQKRLRAQTKTTKPTTEGKLAGVLGKRTGDFQANGDAMTGAVAAGQASVPQASREYTSAAGRLYVKITDTGPSPQLRDAVTNALTEQRSVQGRYSRGALVQGFPALVTYAPRQRSGKAAVIVDGRYLLEARLAPAKQPEDIIHALEALDLSRLTK